MRAGHWAPEVGCSPARAATQTDPTGNMTLTQSVMVEEEERHYNISTQRYLCYVGAGVQHLFTELLITEPLSLF